MIWTTQKPDREGYWWYTEGFGKTVMAILIVHGDIWAIEVGDANSVRLDSLSGEWSSEPIPAPEEHP